MDTLSPLLTSLVDGVPWNAWRLELDLPLEKVSLSTLRGVWGAALHDLDASVYATVFEGLGHGTAKRPLYVLRIASDDAGLECVHLGAALKHEATLMRAWQVAGEKGLGKQRRPFRVRETSLLTTALEFSRNFPWPEQMPCRIACRSPLRLLRMGKLIAAPTLHDVALGALRRIWDLQENETAASFQETAALLENCCNDTPTLYEPAERKRITRYSGRQHRDLELRCVMSPIILPEGPGALAPLLNAAQWLHVGKGASIGMGQVELQPLRKPE